MISLTANLVSNDYEKLDSITEKINTAINMNCELNRWIENSGAESIVPSSFISILYDFIEYDNTKNVTIKYNKNLDPDNGYMYFFGVSYYDENKEFIDRGNTQTTTGTLTQQLRENGKYIRPQFQVRPKPEGVETIDDFIKYFDIVVIDSDGNNLLSDNSNPIYQYTSAIDNVARDIIDKKFNIQNLYIDKINLFNISDELFANDLANKFNIGVDKIILTKSDLVFRNRYTSNLVVLVNNSTARISTRIKYNGGYNYIYAMQPWQGEIKDEPNDLVFKIAFIDKNITTELGRFNTWSIYEKYIEAKIPQDTYYIEFAFAIDPNNAAQNAYLQNITEDDIPDDFQIILSKTPIIYNLSNKLKFIEGHNLTNQDTIGTTYNVNYCPNYINVRPGMKLYMTDFKYGIRINFYNNGKFVESRNDGIIPYYTIQDGINQIRVQYWNDKPDILNNSHYIYLYTNTPLDSEETYLSVNPIIEEPEEETDINDPLKHHRFYGKRLSILGDSISTFSNAGTNGPSPEGNPYTYPGNRCRYPQDNLFTNVEDCYWYKLMQHYNMILGINESWAGSRTMCTSSVDNDDQGPNRCISSATRIGHLGENGTPDVILVYAGTNDAGGKVTVGSFDYEDPKNYTDEQISALSNTNSFAEAYRTMLIRLLKNYPNSIVICLLINYTTSYYTSDETDKYNEIIKEACDYFGVQWIDLRAIGINIYNKSNYLPDGVHPNALGTDLIYRGLINQLDYLYAY